MAKKKNKLKKRILQFSLLLFLVGGLAWIFIPSPIAVRVEEARIGSFSATIEAEGKTQARHRVVIWAPVAGVSQRMPLVVGSPVVVEQIVARLIPDATSFHDPQRLQFLKERAATAQAAKDRILALREQTAAVVNQARENLGDADRLVSTGTEKAMQREQAQIAMKLIFKELASMDAAALAMTFDIAAAESALIEFKGEAPPEWVMRAPFSGTVLSVAESGSRVGLGASLIEIGNPADLEVNVEIPASNAVQVSAGQYVQLKFERLDALSGRVRRVEVIPPTNAEMPEKARIAIEFIALPSKLKALGDNQTVQARITLATIDHVLKISSKSLIQDGQETAVFVIEKGRARKRTITLSARDADTVVVERGLKERDRLILDPGPKIKEGVRVKEI